MGAICCKGSRGQVFILDRPSFIPIFFMIPGVFYVKNEDLPPGVVYYLMYPGTDAGKLINIKRSAVSHAVHCGSAVITENPNLISDLPS